MQRVMMAGMALGFPDDGFPVSRFSLVRRFTANEKDFSLSLEMTVQEISILASLSSPRG